MSSETVITEAESPASTRLIGVQELCELWGVTRTWVHDNVENGTIPCVRLSSRQLRFDVVRIERWLDERRDNETAGASVNIPTPRRAESAGRCVLPPHMA